MINDWKKYSPFVLRLGLGLVFIWFGYSGLTNTQMWLGLVPDWTASIAPPATLVVIHGWLELIGGLLLIVGWQVRWVSAILLLNLIHTITLLSYGPIMVRDIGLALALLAAYLNGQDKEANA